MEKIYMIPVNDAYTDACGCPLCDLKEKSERNYLEYYLGPSLMEPDTRKITNKTGFCPDHMGKLNRSVTNRLGLGLMMHTHLKDFHADISSDLKNLVPTGSGLMKSFNTEYKGRLNAAADRIDSRVAACHICDKMNDAMKHYVEVIAWMFIHDNDFRTRFSAVPFHCLPHLSMLLRQAATLNQNDAREFVSVLAEKNYNDFESLLDDVEFFTLKFDYRNQDKPWGNSKNSIQRAMRFLSSDRRDFDEQQSKKQS